MGQPGQVAKVESTHTGILGSIPSGGKENKGSWPLLLDWIGIEMGV